MLKLFKVISSLRHSSERGAGLFEHTILISLVVTVAFLSIEVLGGRVSDKVCDAAAGLNATAGGWGDECAAGGLEQGGCDPSSGFCDP